MAPTPEKPEKGGTETGHESAPKLSTHEAELANVLTAEIGKELEQDKEGQMARVAEAQKKIDDHYDEKARRVDTAHAESAEYLFLKALKLPIEHMLERWNAEREHLANTITDINQLREALRQTAQSYEGQLEVLVNTANGYIDKMVEDTEYITPEKLAEMSKSVNRSAFQYAKLLETAGNEDLKEAFQASLGLEGKYGSADEAMAAAVKVMPGYIEKEFEKGEKNLMSAVWMILSFMPAKERVEIAEAYKAKIKDPVKLERFLVEGNKFGAFSSNEMEDIRGAVYTEEQKKQYAEVYVAVKDFADEAKRLMTTPYGTTNAANEMLDLGSIGMFLADLAAGLTIFMNYGVGIWKGGAMKSPRNMVEMLTNRNVLLSGAVLTATHHYRNKKRVDETLMEKGKRELLTYRQALTRFDTKVNGPFGHKWDGFFKSQDHQGLAVFTGYSHEMEKLYGGYPEDRFNRAGFLDYLDLKSKSTDPEDKKIDYAKLKTEFADIGDDDLKTFAELFESLQIGGVTAAADYEKELATVNA